MEHVAEVPYTQPPLLLFPIFLRGVSAQEWGPCCGGVSRKQNHLRGELGKGLTELPGLQPVDRTGIKSFFAAALAPPPTAGVEGSSMCCLTRRFVQTQKTPKAGGGIWCILQHSDRQQLGAVGSNSPRHKEGQSSSLLLWRVTLHLFSRA